MSNDKKNDVPNLADAENKYLRDIREMEADIDTKKKEATSSHLAEVAALHSKHQKARSALSAKRDVDLKTIDSTERNAIAQAKKIAQSDRAKAATLYTDNIEAFNKEAYGELEPHNVAMSAAEEEFAKAKAVRTQEITKQYEKACAEIRAREQAESEAKKSACSQGDAATAQTQG